MLNASEWVPGLRFNTNTAFRSGRISSYTDYCVTNIFCLYIGNSFTENSVFILNQSQIRGRIQKVCGKHGWAVENMTFPFALYIVIHAISQLFHLIVRYV